MAIAKEKMKEVIESQPDDATYEEILRELRFERMVERGLADSREGHVLSNEKMEHRIRSWQSGVAKRNPTPCLVQDDHQL